ncbi:hypothetical protein, partial [Sulfobacillus thermosulfidooxidans]|uniref:hypothetical protein n=1 Tax=Sulfobacillus thermosulfidooxidans TaxID=28034 RepID=UPI00048E85F1
MFTAIASQVDFGLCDRAEVDSLRVRCSHTSQSFVLLANPDRDQPEEEEPVLNDIIIFVGGFLGAVARFQVGQ